MAFIGNFILRSFMILLALSFAFVAAGSFVGFGFYNEIIAAGPPLQGFEQQIVTMGSFLVAVISTTLIGSYSIALVASAITLAEIMRWQGLITYLALSGLVTLFLAGINFSDAAVSIGVDGPAPNGALMVSLSAGFIAGFTYWLFAGRNAGNWLDTQSKDAPSSKS